MDGKDYSYFFASQVDTVSEKSRPLQHNISQPFRIHQIIFAIKRA